MSFSSSPGADPTGKASPKPDRMLLTDLDPVANGDGGGTEDSGYFEVGSGTVDNTDYGYGRALVSAFSYDEEVFCSGYWEYNLSREWEKLTMLTGIDDDSEHRTAWITVELDDKKLYEGEIAVGKPAHITRDITRGLRLRISHDTAPGDGSYCDMGDVVIGNPTLRR
ncbi:NPCBM/NEW2 domain-containing protein [Streptomyces violaceusniger]|uniref:NPCBM/NEW2 domain-containing protein n=1 Tax=Streptomyces violaceusniger TaxID=68280 RepID=UPI00343542B6